MPSTRNIVTLEQLAAKAGNLYSLPAVALEVLRLTAQPQVDVHLLQLCIEKDPALTARILRVVNSSLFGLGRHVSSLNQALALLGIKPLKLLVLGFSLPSELFIGLAGDLLGRFWRRTITKAVAARELAETIWKIPGDEPFLAGLLQNVGMLVLIQEMGEPYLELLDTALSKATDVGAAEQRALGFTHYELSARLLERWGLPPTLVSAIGIGPAPEKIDALGPLERRLPRILHLAEILSSLLAENRGDLLPILMRSAIRYCELTHTQLLTLVNELQGKVQQVAEALNLEIDARHDYNGILMAAHTQMSVVAADAANDLIRAYRFMESAADMESPPAQSPLTLREQLWTDSPDDAGSPALAVADAAASTAVATKTPSREPVATEKPRSGTAFAPDSEFLELLGVLVANCRQARQPISLLLLTARMKNGPVGIDPADIVLPVAEMTRRACAEAGHARAICRPLSKNGVAIVLPDCDRQDAIYFGNELIQAYADRGEDDGQQPSSHTQPLAGASTARLIIAVGLAATDVPSKSFNLREWITRAERCLAAVEQSGASGLKSIEIY